MQRDIQKILLHWGGWVSQGRINVGWSSICVGFKHGLNPSTIRKLSCSDEDGLIIDSCVARLRSVGMAEEYNFIECYYVKSMPKRAIGRKYRLGESEIRKRMSIAESFILGCLSTSFESLELDLLYNFPRHKQSAYLQNATTGR
ncbi:antiterminator Q family protein [Arsenophonus nasoniae]|uniref:antiterminator Q family protein n=2 Tax=Arsenophonus nasoniae TaxID=638 RepID=UPI003878FAB1